MKAVLNLRSRIDDPVNFGSSTLEGKTKSVDKKILAFCHDDVDDTSLLLVIRVSVGSKDGLVNVVGKKLC